MAVDAGRPDPTIFLPKPTGSASIAPSVAFRASLAVPVDMLGLL